MFAVELIDAGRGDCVLLSYGDVAAPRRVLIDGGPSSSYFALRRRIEQIPERPRRIELLVVTHIDLDHIEGVLRLLQEADELELQIGEVWYNAYHHLGPPDALGPLDAEKLAKLLRARKYAWNRAFGGEAVAVQAALALPEHELDGGLRLTVLGPSPVDLLRLRPSWETRVRAAGLVPNADTGVQPDDEQEPPADGTLGPLYIPTLAEEPFRTDRSLANFTSITLLAEYSGRSCLLTGDAPPAALVAGLESLLRARGLHQLAVDAFKPSHHGSRRSLNKDLLKLVRARRYLISSDGSHFGHPHREAIARILVHGTPCPTLCFSHRSASAQTWAHPKLQAKHGYTAVYPDDDGTAGVCVVL